MNIEIIKNIRNKIIKEKFPNVKAIVQNDELGNIIDIFPNSSIDDFKDEYGYYSMTIEQAFELRKIKVMHRFDIFQTSIFPFSSGRMGIMVNRSISVIARGKPVQHRRR